MRPAPAVRHLSLADPVLGELIQDVGPCKLIVRQRRSPFESLARAIAYQQLHERAAESIIRRFRALFPGCRFPRPDQVLAMDADRLRTAGFSRAKVAALRDLADKVLDGTVPSGRLIARLDDEVIVERLMEIRGVGRWTAQMLLIFQLGRQDVLPIDDFGLRNGFRILYDRRSLPAPAEVLRFGERWRPYRTAASWYLWRAAERANLPKA